MATKAKEVKNVQVATSATPATPDLSAHTVADLKKLAADRGLSFKSKATKADLLAMLNVAAAPTPVKEQAKQEAPRKSGER